MLLQQWHRKLLKDERSCTRIRWPLLPSAISRNTYFTHIYWTSVCVSSKTPPIKLLQETLVYKHLFDLGFTLLPPLFPGCFLPYMTEIITIVLNPISQRLEPCSSPLWNILLFRPNVTSSERPSLNTSSNIEFPVTSKFLHFCFSATLITIRLVQCLFS